MYTKKQQQAYDKARYKSRYVYVQKKMKEHNVRLKIKAFDILGNHCACCGETQPQFFTIDHVHNDGAAERRKHLDRSRFVYKEVIRGVIGRYQILCWNCNLGKRFNGGTCPHKR